MSFIVIGGGISGLYSAYSLHKCFGINNIIVIEKNKRLGGRIDTIDVDGQLIELGAGGVVNVQHNVLSLLAELGLTVINSNANRSFALTSTISTKEIFNEHSIVPSVYRINDIISIKNTDFYDVINDLIIRLNDLDFYKTALSYNLYALIEKMYGNSKADQLMYQFGYHSDFSEQNSVQALQMFTKEFSPNSEFYRVSGGMSAIINALELYLIKNNIIIKTSCQCTDIKKRNNNYVCLLDNGDEYEANNVIVAIPKTDIMKIPFFSIVKEKLASVFNKPLSRIYVFFPKTNGKIWFDHINGTLTSKTLLSQIVPINKDKGILMIYTDGLNARTLYCFEKNNILKRELMYHLIKLFSDIDIPMPTKIITSFHDSATHVWKPSVDPYQMYKEIMKPIDSEKVYIVGEAYSLNQQWSEGAVQSVNDLMDRIRNQFLVSNNNKTMSLQ
jgi:monoamine oxidase